MTLLEPDAALRSRSCASPAAGAISRLPDSAPPVRGRKPPRVPDTNVQLPEPSERKVSTSLAWVTMLAAPGSTIAELAVIVRAPANRHSRTSPGTVVPKDVIVEVPVICTDSASAVPRSVVEAEARVADDRALVDRTIAWVPRR